MGRLEYWRLSGGATSGEIKEVRQPGRGGGPVDANELATEARAGLVALLLAFGQNGAPLSAGAAGRLRAEIQRL